MSTSVSGYRLRRGVKLEHLINKWQPRVREYVVKAIRNKFWELAEQLKLDNPGLIEALKKYPNEQIARLAVAEELLEKEIKRTFVEPRKWGDKFDFYAVLTFRFYKGRIYIQAYSGHAVDRCWHFLQRDRRLQDFGATNASDHQRYTIGQRAWRHRLKVWDAIYADNGNLRYLSLPILTDFIEAQNILFQLRWEFAEKYMPKKEK